MTRIVESTTDRPEPVTQKQYAKVLGVPGDACSCPRVRPQVDARELAQALVLASECFQSACKKAAMSSVMNGWSRVASVLGKQKLREDHFTP